MAFSIGSLLGAYEIAAELGRGGMGEVYRARDTKLGRDVALKILNRGSFKDAESLARFRREAQVLAALNHPNIGAIYGIDEANGTQFLILELVDGESLDRLIARGPLPVDRALDIARQMIAALDVAHASGIVHRDLKPSNIALTKSGAVKILDFGLAKAESASSDSSVEAAESPTRSVSPVMTAAGIVLGTAAYMSPEQARGLPADRRSDIWSFGCVVYEMLTGRRLFAGDTISDTLAAVLTREPDWQHVPARARRLLRKSLERDPQLRLRDIGDASMLLDEPPPAQAPSRTLRWVFAAALIAAAIAATTLGLVLLQPAAVDRPFTRLGLDLGNGLRPNALVDAAISSDGTRLVFHARDASGRRLLATRRLNEREATLLAGTEGADQPFFSPDGDWIGFFAGNKLKKVSVHGGTPVDLADTGVPRGASWADDGRIVVALTNSRGLSWVSPDGGGPTPLTKTSPGDPTHRWPQVLPGAKAVIFTANAPTLNSYEDATIDIQLLDTGERRTLWRGGYFGRYAPTRGTRGHLVYIRRGVLFGVPFDPERLAIEGTPTPLLDDVAANSGAAAGHFDFSRTGTLIYRSGVGLQPWTIAWLEPSGKTQPLLPKPSLYYSPRISPGGDRLAVGIDGGKGADIYTYDWQRDQLVRLTFNGDTNADPVWAPDGKHVLFRGGLTTTPALWWVRADGAGSPVRLLEVRAGDLGPNSFSPDGRRLIFSALRDGGGQDLWTVSLDLLDPDHPKAGIPQPFLVSPANEARPAFSPDGRWVAYVSDEGATWEIYVRSASAAASRPDGKWQVSMGGGAQIMWSRVRPELFFTAGNQVMVATYTAAEGTFIASKPRVWTPFASVGDTGFSSVDLAPDGKRFAIFTRPGAQTGEEAPRVQMLFNFFEEVRRLAPGK